LFHCYFFRDGLGLSGNAIIIFLKFLSEFDEVLIDLIEEIAIVEYFYDIGMKLSWSLIFAAL